MTRSPVISEGPLTALSGINIIIILLMLLSSPLDDMSHSITGQALFSLENNCRWALGSRDVLFFLSKCVLSEHLCRG